VGGSGFYISALYFLLYELPVLSDTHNRGTWEDLYAIDPHRALKVNRSDTYRIQRALAIWQATGIKPSEFEPLFNPRAPSLFIVLDRERAPLYARINERVKTMLAHGWIDEVKALMGTDWISFLLQKKLIGYPEIIHFLAGKQSKTDYDLLVASIQQKTRNYAKRQISFFSMLKKKLSQYSV
jgi:tRNA dimethylallyltransferase